MQVVVSRSTYQGSPEAFAQMNKTLCRGDIIGIKKIDYLLLFALCTETTSFYVVVSGVPGKTNHGQLSIYATERLDLLSPCLHDIPKTKLNDAVSASAEEERNPDSVL